MVRTKGILQTADCRLQTADCRLQTADCRQIKQVFKITKAFKIIINNISVLEKENLHFKLPI